jgi:FixJ family two-component response regulator
MVLELITEINNKKMRQEIYDIIRNDVPLRKTIADYLGISDNTVYLHATRMAPKLNDFIIVKIIMKHTGKKEKEIFTEETLKFIK